MLPNNTYNLMAQMVEESQSIWRLKTHYQPEAGDCDECLTFWNKLLAEKERTLEELQRLVKSHLT